MKAEVSSETTLCELTLVKSKERHTIVLACIAVAIAVALYIISTSLTCFHRVRVAMCNATSSHRSMEIELLGVGGKNYNLVINDLLMPINTAKSTAKVQ